jgi:hypothetical protein
MNTLTKEEQKILEREKVYINWFFDGMNYVQQLCQTECSSEAIFWMYTGLVMHWTRHFGSNFKCPFDPPWMMKDIPWSWNKRDE